MTNEQTRKRNRRQKLKARYFLRLDTEIAHTREKLEMLLDIKEYG